MRNFRLVTIVSLTLFLHAGGALAALLWDNGAPNAEGGSNMSDTFQAEDFTVSSASNLTSVRFWNLQTANTDADYNGSIFWQIVNDAGGAPGNTVLASGTASPTRALAGSALGLDRVQNDFNVPATNLLAGTYWLQLHNGPLAQDGFTDFYWNLTDIGGANTSTNRGSELYLPDSTFGWTTNGTEHAFLLNAVAPVPEPGTTTLFGLGLAWLALRRRRA